MKTQGFKKLSVLAIALLMLAGTNLYAQRGRNYSEQGNRGLNQDRACQMIPDLTEDQEAKINALRINHLKEMTGFRNQMNELQAKKQTLMTSDNSDLKDLNATIDQITNVHSKMMKASAKHQQDVRGLLSDEQKVYFDSRPMRGHGHGKGMRHDGYGRGAGQGSGRGLNPECPYNEEND